VKRFLSLFVLILIVACVCAAGCTGTTSPSNETPTPQGSEEETSPCLYIFSCNVDGAEVSLFNGKVMVDRQKVEDGVAIFELSPNTEVRSATVTADGYNPAPVTALNKLKSGENQIYYITLEKKSA